MKLIIRNKGASACTYSINILRCAQTTATLKKAIWIFRIALGYILRIKKFRFQEIAPRGRAFI